MVAAFFDVDGTMAATNVLMPLWWFQRATLSCWRFWLWQGKLALWVPLYLVADSLDRRWFVRLFFRQYAGLDAQQVREWHQVHFERMLKPRLFADAVAQVRWHQSQGHRVVLVTGGAEFAVAPLADWLNADLLAAQLEERNGKFTGRLVGEVLIGEGRANAVRAYAERNGVDLRESYAYGDNISDAFLLQCVGHPVAVNPDRQLRQLAKRMGWKIVRWR